MARRKSPGSVYQRADGKWVAQLYAGDGRKMRRYASDETAAKALLREMRRTPQAKAPRAITVADQLRHWEADVLPVSGLAPGTVRTYRVLVRSPLIPTLGNERLSSFTPTAAEKWLTRLAAYQTRGKAPEPAEGAPKATGETSPRKVYRTGKPIGQSTQRLAFAVLHRALDAAVRDGLIVANPLDSVRRPSPGRSHVPMSTDVDTLLESMPADENIRPLTVFVAWTGCRVGEALALRWEDVDLDRAVAVLRRGSQDRDATKTGGIRAVPLVPAVVEALRPRHAATGLVFTSVVGGPLDSDSARRTLKRYLREADLPTARPWHTMRHSCASRLLNHGVPMPVVSKILGHASISTTVDVYGHIDPALAAEQMAEALSGPRLRVVS